MRLQYNTARKHWLVHSVQVFGHMVWAYLKRHYPLDMVDQKHKMISTSELWVSISEQW